MDSLRGRQVLVVEDDLNAASVVEASLRSAGVEVTVVHTGRGAIDTASQPGFDLLLLDLGLPDLDGIEVLRRLRQAGNAAPAVFLSAHDSPEQKVEALRAGALDYVAKPFHFGELLERLAIALRHGSTPAATRAVPLGDLVVDLEAVRVTRGSTELHLTPTEFRLLEVLVANLGRVVTRQQIVDAVWDYHYDGDTTIIDSAVSTLRKKIDTPDFRPIETVRGFGYRIQAQQ